MKNNRKFIPENKSKFYITVNKFTVKKNNSKYAKFPLVLNECISNY